MKEVRPTSGKVLQALFNILGPLDGKCFLDLFSGTGRVAGEAWSRNARRVVAVELLKNRSSLINIPREPESEREFIVLAMDVRRALRWLGKKNLSFDIVFADPPYNAGWPAKIVNLIVEVPCILNPKGYFFLEHSVREPLLEIPQEWILADQRKYGGTLLSIITKRDTDRGDISDE